MQIYKFESLAWDFLHLLDSDVCDHVTVKEVISHIEHGTLASLLANRLVGIDLSTFEPGDWKTL